VSSKPLNPTVTYLTEEEGDQKKIYRKRNLAAGFKYNRKKIKVGQDGDTGSIAVVSMEVTRHKKVSK